MKKLLSIALAVVMVLGVASVAMAVYDWSGPAASSQDTFASRYQIDVVKLTNQTGIIGTNSMIADDNAVAVNNAPVYFYIKLAVSGASAPADADAIQANAQVQVDLTSLTRWDGATLDDLGWAPINTLGNGTYYYDANQCSFMPLDDDRLNSGNGNSAIANAVIEARVLDTETAKVSASVRSQRPLEPGVRYTVGKFIFEAYDNLVHFYYDRNGTLTHIVTFERNDDGLVIDHQYNLDADADNADKVMELYAYLNDGNPASFKAAVEGEQIYMSNDNLRRAFGFSYSQSDSATWAASTTPIILDPVVSIPKTGDNASVIGFAMIMVAVVAAAVAVKKVRA